jgi:hypothetical protein
MNWKTLFAVVTLTASSADAALIANWGQDDLTGFIVDSTGNHPDGISTGFPTHLMPGVPNGNYGAISINNANGFSIEYGPTVTDEFFTIGADNLSPVMNLGATGSFTVMGWMNPYPLLVATARNYKVLSTGSAAGVDRGWGLSLRMTQIDGTGSSVRFTGFGIADNDSSTFNLTFGNWIHLAVTYDNGLITYFLNGNMLDSDVRAFENESANGRLTVGSRVGGNDSDQMNGLLDGIRVYDQVLTPAEIQQAAVESVSAIPEPSSAVLGLAGLFALVRRKRGR